MADGQLKNLTPMGGRNAYDRAIALGRWAN